MYCHRLGKCAYIIMLFSVMFLVASYLIQNMSGNHSYFSILKYLNYYVNITTVMYTNFSLMMYNPKKTSVVV